MQTTTHAHFALTSRCNTINVRGNILLFVSIWAAAAFSSFAQTTILSENFEGNFPEDNGWSVGDSNSSGSPAYWNDVSSTFGGETPHGGLWKGYCAGVGFAGTTTSPLYTNSMNAYMSKSINLSGYSSASLTFWYKIPSIESCCDSLKVTLGTTVIGTFSAATGGWVQQTVNLAGWLGASYVLKFEFISDGSVAYEGAYLDDILVTGTSTCADFIVQSISLSPASPTAGQSFQVNVIVRNQGSCSADGGYLDLWKHQPSAQVCGVDGDSWMAVGTLAAGESKQYSTSLTAASAGSYTFRAYVDSQCTTPESNEGNNQATRSYTVAAPACADFVVTSITFSPTTPVAGSTYTAYVTVRNQGTCSATGGWLDVWKHQTSSQSCGVTGDDYVSVGTLAAGASATFTFSGLTMASAGTYTFRAFVDSGCTTPETSDANNQTTQNYTVTAPACADFVVTSITFSPTTPVAGSTYTAYVTVRNQGTCSATGGWLDVWKHETSSQSCGVIGDDYVSVGTLAAGASATFTFSGLTMASAGTYTFRAFVDSGCTTPETSDANNQTTQSYTVSPQPQLPDFVVTAISFSPSVPQCGQPFTAYVTVRNQGAGAGPGGWLDVWVNQPSSQSCGADGNTWVSVGTLAAGASQTFTFSSLAAPASGAAWIFRAFIDSACATTESNDANNQTTVSYGQCVQLPDFTIQSISLSPSSPIAGQPFTAYVTVRNQGSGSGDGRYLDVWMNQPSSQGCVSDGNAWQSVGTVAAGATKTLTFSGLTAPATAGSYTFRAFVDSYCQTPESSDANNQGTLGYTVTVPVQQPDFVVTSVTLSPTTPVAGQPFTAYVTVRNQGAVAGDGGWLDVWAHQSSAPACGTDGNTWASVGALSAGQSKTFTLTLIAPAAAGSYTFRAFVDSYCQTTESNDGNNQTTLAYTVGAGTQPPDFVVTAISFSPAQPVGGQPFTAYVTVRNQGAGLGNAGWLDVWANQPSIQTCGADGNQYQSVGTLAVGQSIIKTFNLTAPVGGAPWTFRAYADSGCQTTESSDANNQTTVSYGANPVQSPDFIITGITISPTAVKAGAPFTAYVTVKNQGAGSGDAGWLDVWANAPMTASCGALGNAYQQVGILAAGASKTLILSLTAGAAGLNTLLTFVDSACQSSESNEANNQKTYSYAVSPPELFPMFVGILGAADYGAINDSPNNHPATLADSDITTYIANEFGALNSQDINDLRTIATNDTGGLFALAFFLSGKANSRSFISEPGNSDLSKQDIDSYFNDHPEAKLFLGGHSAGGGDIQNLLRKLRTLGIPVELSGHIDSVEFLSGDAEIPDNTKRAMGFYQNECFPEGESNLFAEDATKTTVSNTDINQAAGPADPNVLSNAYHRNMDNDERVWGVLLDYIKSLLP